MARTQITTQSLKDESVTPEKLSFDIDEYSKKPSSLVITENYTASYIDSFLIVENPTTIFLPQIQQEPINITITNKSSGEINIIPYNGDLINDNTTLNISMKHSTAQLRSNINLGWIII